MKLGIAQLNTHGCDFSTTPRRMAEASQRAAAQEVDLLIFPLSTLTGTYVPDFADHEGFLLDLSDALTQLGESLACPCIVPLITGDPAHCAPDALLVDNVGITSLCHAWPLTYGPSVTDTQTSAGAPEVNGTATRFTFADTRFCLSFTYEGIEACLDKPQDVDALLFISGYNYALDDPSSALGAALSENRFRADALALDAWLVAAGSLGSAGGQVYTGSSFVLSPEGELVASAPAFEEALLVTQIGPVTPAVVDEALNPELYDRSLHLWEALCLGLHDYAEAQGRQTAALALDGSLASCLLAALATDALGPTHVHAVIDAQDDERAKVARRVANALRIAVEDMPKSAAGSEDERFQHDMAQVYVAMLARRQKALPISCEDKTFLALEVSAPSCRAAELLPFGDVYRTDLVELAHLRNTISPVIPTEAFAYVQVPDIEGLNEAEQTPETRLRRIDMTLATYVEWERCLSDVADRQGAPNVTQAILQRLHATTVARAAWPACLMVSSRMLADVHIPMGNAWEDRVRDQLERLEGLLAMDQAMDDEEYGDDRAPVSSALANLPDLSSLLEGLDGKVVASSLPEGVDRASLEAALTDLLGLIQDMVQHGGQPQIDGPFGPMTWGSPFSEN